ncbi:Protein MICROTUBULE BINDING PROTEIN 2C [Glycine soja]
MHERQRLVDSEEKRDLYDPNSPLSERDADLDRVLFNNLVQIVPLVQSFIDGEGRSSFTRQGSMVYTKRPSRKSRLKRECWSIYSCQKEKGSWRKRTSRKMRFDTRKGQKDESVILKEQVEELQMKILEKDELIESSENTKKQMKALEQKLYELKHHASEKDSLLKSTKRQLFDVKFELADKQAALEKIHWEAMTSNKKVEKLQEELDSMQGDISSFTLLLNRLTISDTAEYTDDYDIKPYEFNHLRSIDDWDEMEMQKMEEARKTYIAAVVAGKEKQDEESMATVVNSRLQLESILFKPT